MTYFTSDYSICYYFYNSLYNYNCLLYGFIFTSSLNTDFYFTNNIFIGTGKLVNGPTSGEKFIGNVWWSPDGKPSFRKYNSLEEWAEKTGQEILHGKLAGIQADPMLTGQLPISITDPYQIDSLKIFRLRSDSPLKNKGMDVTAMYKVENVKKDLYGNKVPSGSSVEPGVYELPE